jgi:hypothetical protein
MESDVLHRQDGTLKACALLETSPRSSKSLTTLHYYTRLAWKPLLPGDLEYCYMILACPIPPAVSIPSRLSVQSRIGYRYQDNSSRLLIHLPSRGIALQAISSPPGVPLTPTIDGTNCIFYDATNQSRCPPTAGPNGYSCIRGASVTLVGYSYLDSLSGMERSVPCPTVGYSCAAPSIMTCLGES